ncbi:MAG: DUF4258 domain-containing protein [Roseomonas sp.]|nr:DUF4258 domain-containing protein [Roseomonas sp.]
MFRRKESASLGVLLAQGAAIVWSRHALERAHERSVSKLDAERVIRRGRVTGLDLQADGQERCQLAGKDEDGHAFTVVITPIAPDVLVVTVIT